MNRDVLKQEGCQPSCYFCAQKEMNAVVEELLCKTLEQINEEIEKMVKETVDNAYANSIFKR